MQDRYVGDVGDFAKYALLRALVQQSLHRLGIVWCLFENETHNYDGRHTNYLKEQEFRSLDSQLHDQLKRIVDSDRRSVRGILRSGIFPAGTVSFHLPIAPSSDTAATRAVRERHRTEWLSKALAATASCDLVFFDPDNGLETPSVSKHSAKAGKYIFMDELNLFWERGQSLVIYHHLNRTASVREQTKVLNRRIVAEFASAAIVRSVLFRRGSCRHFWILGQTQHALELNSRVEGMLNSGWANFFEVG